MTNALATRAAISAAWMALAGAAAAGCAAQDTGGPTDAAAAPNFAPKDVATDSDTADAPHDAAEAGPSAGDTGSTPIPDAGDSDKGSALDAGSGAWKCTGPGLPGCACANNADCDSGHCVDTPNDGKVCSANCTDSCPAGWQCVANGTTDIVYFCLPQWPVLCNPCDADADCSVAGSGKAVCVDRGVLGHYCGAACTASTDCPAGYSCDAVKTVSGKQAQQCMPAANSQGQPVECACSKSAVASALGTSCSAVAKAADGTVLGECGGVRQCGPTGLSACTAIVGTEICNGKDDDCDGLVDESACDDGNLCTADLCDAVAMACSHTPTQGACDADNNACTVNDACTDGKCAPGAAKKCDDGNPCTIDACLPAKGCTATIDDGIGCDDGDLCSIGDVCAGGQCVPGKPKVCAAAALCTTVACDGKTGQCAATNQADGTACDDSSACTEKDLCASGACKGATVDCNDSNPCTQDACDSAAGCKHTANSAPCDDGNACTENDACANSSCAGKAKPASDCDDANPCTTDSCEPKAGCAHAANTALCDDGNPCTKGDQCKDKACVPGTSTCQCQADADCKDDGNLCNGTPYCDKTGASFACKTNPATVVNCPAGANTACSVNTCDSGTGKCAPLAQADGKDCDSDGSVCTVGDSCEGGKCLAGPKLNCDDGTACTDDTCDAKAGCAHTNNSAVCDADANGCTTPDLCKNGACIAGNIKSCDDANACTADSCDKATGACKNVGGPLDSQNCDADGSLCTNPDVCAGGVCKAGAPVGCDDQNPCTTDTCAATKGCQHANVADKTGCTTGHWCIATAGVSQCVKAPLCGDSVVDAGEECDDGNAVPNDGCTGCKLDKPGPPAAGEMIITEIMAAPSIATADEWIELYNASAKKLDLKGTYFGDSNYYFVIDVSLVVAPGQYVVFAAQKLVGGTGGVVPDYSYGYSTQGVALSNTGEYVCLSTDTQCATGVIAKVTYPKATAGKSYQLAAGKLDKTAQDNAANWCNGKVPYGSYGDFGTPGKPNSTCP